MMEAIALNESPPQPIDGDLANAASQPALIARLLDEQQSLSAAEQFSNWHLKRNATEQIARYQSLLPAAHPRPGEQYAFEVDLDRCSGCKACVTACHTLNGLDEGETWRDVGLLVGGGTSLPVLQHVTAACHHCLDPACMTACPVNAYEKDPLTGIVKHLDDQCFGCQYCTMACPYDVPKYHAAKGIVRKCDMCSSRLAVGEPPACVQACPHEAITIRVVSRVQVIEDAEAAVFLPAAPDPQLTLPTTTYKTRRALPRNLLPADYLRINPQHAHWPLVVMLVLTQLSVGAFITGMVLEWCSAGAFVAPMLASMHAANAWGFGMLALCASIFHLGRPRYAYRAILGLRHSWLSREIIAFGAFAVTASAYSTVVILSQWMNVDAEYSALRRWTNGLGWCVVLSGAVGIGCSVMIYVFTRRECWSLPRVAVRFLLTTAVLGVAATWLSIWLATAVYHSPQWTWIVHRTGPALGGVLVSVSGFKLIWEAAIFRNLLASRMTPLRRSAILLSRDLSRVFVARFALGAFGGMILPAILWNALPKLSSTNALPFLITAMVMFVACVAGELLERYLFFAACAAPRMPGGIR